MLSWVNLHLSCQAVQFLGSEDLANSAMNHGCRHLLGFEESRTSRFANCLKMKPGKMKGTGQRLHQWACQQHDLWWKLSRRAAERPGKGKPRRRGRVC